MPLLTLTPTSVREVKRVKKGTVKRVKRVKRVSSFFFVRVQVSRWGTGKSKGRLLLLLWGTSKSKKKGYKGYGQR